jgi:hypothetical protein
MKVTVYVVVTNHRWGDEVRAFGTSKEAEAFVMEYAREFWDTKKLGRLPRSYRRLYDAWGEQDLWGSVESRWEFERCEIDVPQPTRAARRVA